MVFEVEIVLLHTQWVKRNAGEGTPAKCQSMGNGSDAVPRSCFIGKFRNDSIIKVLLFIENQTKIEKW